MNTVSHDLPQHLDVLQQKLQHVTDDPQNGLKDELAEDAVHLNKAGYAIMGPLAEKAIAEALQAK